MQIEDLKNGDRIRTPDGRVIIVAGITAAKMVKSGYSQGHAGRYAPDLRVVVFGQTRDDLPASYEAPRGTEVEEVQA